MPVNKSSKRSRQGGEPSHRPVGAVFIICAIVCAWTVTNSDTRRVLSSTATSWITVDSTPINTRIATSTDNISLLSDEPSITDKATTSSSTTASNIAPGKFFWAHNGNGNAVGEFRALIQDVFPEYRGHPLYPLGERGRDDTADRLHLQKLNSSKNDLFLWPVGLRYNSLITDWVHNEFQGKTIFGSGENSDIPTPLENKQFFLGPRNPPLDSSSSSSSSSSPTKIICLYYLQMVVWFNIRRNRSFDSKVAENLSLFHPDTKPRGTKEHFLIYAQGNCVSFREEAFDRLSEIGPKTHIGGICQGKTPIDGNTKKEKVNTGVVLDTWWKNAEVYHKYRFCLTMEHASTDGYVTEKILLAYMGGCIPIYYGTSEIFDLFNKESFIFYNISDPTPALEKVAYLENNPVAYDAMMGQPILANGEKTIEDYFSFSDDTGNGKLKTKIRSMLLDNSNGATAPLPEQSEKQQLQTQSIALQSPPESPSYLLGYNESFGFFGDIHNTEWGMLKEKSLSMQADALKLSDAGKLEQGETLFDYFDPDFNCRHERKVGGLGDGGKWICDPHRLQRGKRCLVYSVGSNGDFSFEEAVKRDIGEHCEVHTFDFGDYVEASKASGTNYHQWGFADKSFTDEQQRTFKTMEETVQELGHRGGIIDIFKIDCEGCEWATSPSWTDANIVIQQISVELHGNVGSQITDFFRRLYQHGYVAFHKEANTRFWRSGPFYEYSFLRLNYGRQD